MTTTSRSTRRTSTSTYAADRFSATTLSDQIRSLMRLSLTGHHFRPEGGRLQRSAPSRDRRGCPTTTRPFNVASPRPTKSSSTPRTEPLGSPKGKSGLVNRRGHAYCPEEAFAWQRSTERPRRNRRGPEPASPWHGSALSTSAPPPQSRCSAHRGLTRASSRPTDSFSDNITSTNVKGVRYQRGHPHARHGRDDHVQRFRLPGDQRDERSVYNALQPVGCHGRRERIYVVQHRLHKPGPVPRRLRHGRRYEPHPGMCPAGRGNRPRRPEDPVR